MIQLHRLNGDPIYINADQIATLEANPDTVITLSNHEKFLVSDSVDNVVVAFKAYQQEIRVKSL